MQYKLAARGPPHPSRSCCLELARNNSDRPGPRNSVALQLAGVARPLREIFPGKAKRRDENVLAHNWAAAGALRRIPRLRLASQTFAPTQPRDRRAIPPFAAQARAPAETRRWPRRGPLKNRARAPKCDESRSRPGLAAPPPWPPGARQAHHPSGLARWRNSCAPAQNRDSVSPQTGSERLQHRSLLAQARPSRESCVPRGSSVQAAPLFRKLRERKPDRPSAAPTYLAGKSQSPAKLNPPSKNPRIARRISPRQRRRKTAARCRVGKKASGNERESISRERYPLSVLKNTSMFTTAPSPQAAWLRFPPG